MNGFLYNIAVAVGADTGSTPPEIPKADFYGSFIQVIITLAVIIVLIVILIKFLAQKSKQWSGDRSLRVLAGVALGQQKSIQVVEIGESIFVVGVGNEITLLDKIDDKERIETLLESIEMKPIAGSGAVQAVSQAINRFRKRPEPHHQPWESNEVFRELLSQKLKGVGSRKTAMKAWLEDEEMQRRSKDNQ